MPKSRLLLPDHFTFTMAIPVRITDLNYAGHVGNDSILSLIHEIRVQFLRHHGYSEINLAGVVEDLVIGRVVIADDGALLRNRGLRS